MTAVQAQECAPIVEAWARGDREVRGIEIRSHSTILDWTWARSFAMSTPVVWITVIPVSFWNGSKSAFVWPSW